jgi:hypothetical protein
MRQMATIALVILTVVVSAVYLPMMYEKVFFKRVEKTHLLFSPVTQRFIYKEKIVGDITEDAIRKAEDHHAEIAYRDTDGTYYTRVEFEKNLPFIYYKNMELWGLLPLSLSGKSFDKKAIKSQRQVLELRPGEINDKRPMTPLWPLLESNPGQARLVFPEDRFRMTNNAMQFVNADTNTLDHKLTEAFTGALKDKGFTFPARSVNGKFSILKPFDEGVFIVDSEYHVYHVKRKDDKPLVVRTPIDSALKTRHIKISENRNREYFGFLLAEDHSLYLITYENYQLVKLPLNDYNPEQMDFKLLINPLYRTAVWSDDKFIHAVALDSDYRLLERHTHRMSRAIVTPMRKVHDVLFPYTLKLSTADGGFLKLSLNTGGKVSLVGIAACLLGYIVVFRVRRRQFPSKGRVGLILATGLYGVIALSFLGSET